MKYVRMKNLTMCLAVAICLTEVILGTKTEKGSLIEYMNNFLHGKSSLNTEDDSMIPRKHHETQYGNVFRFKRRSKEDEKPAANAPAPAASNAAAANGGQAQNLEGWFAISSPAFKNKNKFPDVKLANGTVISISVDNHNNRINTAFDSITEEKPASNKLFYFRLSGLHVYYSSTKTDYNVLGAINIKEISSNIKRSTDSLIFDKKQGFCFTIDDTDYTKWRMCSEDKEVVKSWVCKIHSDLGIVDPQCVEAKDPEVTKQEESEEAASETQGKERIVVVPLPSPQCNENWNYQKNGKDWECDCAELTEQSPINLPRIVDAVPSEVKPFFDYSSVIKGADFVTVDKVYSDAEKGKIVFQLKNNHLRILHPNMGKVVTLDGAVYHAQEIVLHTPSEHTVDGKKYDMEIQIIHFGQSVGDIGKQVILSFLVEKTPGTYNRFIEDLDLFNLPNKLNPNKLIDEIFIPRIFYDNDESSEAILKPFSFYTYQGSLTFPPCSENTIVYVASKPIKLGTTAIQLFQESLRTPDLMNSNGDVIISDWIPQSNRDIQPTNGRPVFHYDHQKYLGSDPVPTPPLQPVGHYEKVTKTITEYFKVSGNEPSGLVGSLVVTDKEALGN